MLELSADTRIDLARSGARHGRGLFETIRLQDGRPRFLAWHLERLAAGCAWLGLDAPPGAAPIEAFLQDRSIGAGMDPGTLRLIAVDEKLLLWAEPLVDAPPQSVRLGLSRRTLRFSANPLNRFKTLAYLENFHLAREAGERDLFEVIAPNEHGRLSDGGRTTLFVVRDGRILTPTLADGALPGIARRVLLEAGLAEEAPLAWESARGAEALFLANALRGVMPVGFVEDGGAKRTDHPLIAEAAARL